MTFHLARSLDWPAHRMQPAATLLPESCRCPGAMALLVEVMKPEPQAEYAKRLGVGLDQGLAGWCRGPSWPTTPSTGAMVGVS